MSKINSYFVSDSNDKNEIGYYLSENTENTDLLQHRGRESAGVAFYKTSNFPNLPNSPENINNKIMTHKSLGLVKNSFTSLLFNPNLPKKINVLVMFVILLPEK